jgi:hypothetical protein
VTNTLAYNGLSPNLWNKKKQKNRNSNSKWFREALFKNHHKNKKDLPETFFKEKKINKNKNGFSKKNPLRN